MPIVNPETLRDAASSRSSRVAVLTDPAHGDALEIVRRDEIPVEDSEELYLVMTQTEYVMSAVPSDAVALAGAARGAAGPTFTLVAGRSLTSA